MKNMLDVALDGTEEIKNYLQEHPEVKAILELSYDGYSAPDHFVIDETAEKHQIKEYMEAHRKECHGYRWYTIYTLEKCHEDRWYASYTLGDGELFQFRGFDAEYWAEEL